jgi:sulfur carrier protein ThiS
MRRDRPPRETKWCCSSYPADEAALIVSIEVFGMKLPAGQERPGEFEMNLGGESDVHTLLKVVGLDSGAGIIVVVNGTVARKGQVLKSGDRVVLFAPIGGG